MTRLHAVRVAALIRRELGVEVEIAGAPYGRFEVSVDGRPVLEGGRLAMLGILPSTDQVLAVVRQQMERVSS